MTWKATQATITEALKQYRAALDAKPPRPHEAERYMARARKALDVVREAAS